MANELELGATYKVTPNIDTSKSNVTMNFRVRVSIGTQKAITGDVLPDVWQSDYWVVSSQKPGPVSLSSKTFTMGPSATAAVAGALYGEVWVDQIQYAWPDVPSTILGTAPDVKAFFDVTLVSPVIVITITGVTIG